MCHILIIITIIIIIIIIITRPVSVQTYCWLVGTVAYCISTKCPTIIFTTIGDVSILYVGLIISGMVITVVSMIMQSEVLAERRYRKPYRIIFNRLVTPILFIPEVGIASGTWLAGKLHFAGHCSLASFINVAWILAIYFLLVR